MEPHADDDREGQPGAVVIDRGQAGSDELIGVGQPANMTQSELRVDVDLLRNREQDASALEISGRVGSRQQSN
jgi:hypothetical protein